MRIRKATKSDWPRISEISKISGYNDYINHVGESYLDNGIVLVAEDKEIMGFCKADLLPDNSAWLGGLRVDPDYRRMGVAKKLTMNLIGETRKAGCKHARLLIEDGNVKSINLAEKVGFVRIKTYSFFEGGIDSNNYHQYEEHQKNYLNLGWEYAFSEDFDALKYGKFYRNDGNSFFRCEENGFCQVLEASSRFVGTSEGLTIIESGRNLERFIGSKPLEGFKAGHLYEKKL